MRQSFGKCSHFALMGKYKLPPCTHELSSAPLTVLPRLRLCSNAVPFKRSALTPTAKGSQPVETHLAGCTFSHCKRKISCRDLARAENLWRRGDAKTTLLLSSEPLPLASKELLPCAARLWCLPPVLLRCAPHLTAHVGQHLQSSSPGWHTQLAQGPKKYATVTQGDWYRLWHTFLQAICNNVD